MDRKLSAVVDKYRNHPEFLGMEIEDVNQPGAVDDTILHIAARMGSVEDMRVLIDYGANVNAVGDLGYTPLHQAAMRGHVKAVRLLLKAGARRDIRNEFVETPADVARQASYAEIVSTLEG